jgi:hypothetical protein
MKIILKRACFFLFIPEILFSGCANSFKAINLTKMNYTNIQNCNNKLEVSYIYNIMVISKNISLAAKEKKNCYSTVAVRIKNISETCRMITQDNFRVYDNVNELKTPDKDLYFNRIKQWPGYYGVYAILGFLPSIGNQKSSTRDSEYENLGFLLMGVTASALNIVATNQANYKFKKFMNDNDIYGKTIKPGETVYGIVIINNANFDPLVFKYLDK